MCTDTARATDPSLNQAQAQAQCDVTSTDYKTPHAFRSSGSVSITVCKSGCTHSTIQAAINSVAARAVRLPVQILVSSGTYVEYLRFGSNLQVPSIIILPQTGSVHVNQPSPGEGGVISIETANTVVEVQSVNINCQTHGGIGVFADFNARAVLTGTMSIVNCATAVQAYGRLQLSGHVSASHISGTAVAAMYGGVITGQSSASLHVTDAQGGVSSMYGSLITMQSALAINASFGFNSQYSSAISISGATSSVNFHGTTDGCSGAQAGYAASIHILDGVVDGTTKTTFHGCSGNSHLFSGTHHAHVHIAPDNEMDVPNWLHALNCRKNSLCSCFACENNTQPTYLYDLGDTSSGYWGTRVSCNSCPS